MRPPRMAVRGQTRVSVASSDGRERVRWAGSGEPDSKACGQVAVHTRLPHPWKSEGYACSSSAGKRTSVRKMWYDVFMDPLAKVFAGFDAAVVEERKAHARV